MTITIMMVIIIPGEHKKVTPVTVDISTMHADFCTRFYTVKTVKLHLTSFIY